MFRTSQRQPEDSRPKRPAPAAAESKNNNGGGYRAKPGDRFLRLMGKKKWGKLDLYMQTAEGREEVDRLSRRRFGKFEWNILHALCWWGAPLTVIKRLCSLYFLASERDALGEIPLHVAIQHSQSVEVVKFLLDVNPATVLAKDDRGRTPLIALCLQLEADGVYEMGGDKLEEYHGVIRALIAQSPQSVSEEDNEGMSAIEHAICGGAPRGIVKSLQKAAIDAGTSRNEAHASAAAAAALLSRSNPPRPFSSGEHWEQARFTAAAPMPHFIAANQPRPFSRHQETRRTLLMNCSSAKTKSPSCS